MNFTRLLVILPFAISLLSSINLANGRTCRLVFPERPGGIPKSAYLFDGEKSRPVFLPSMNLSEVVLLPKGEITLAMTLDEITDPATLPPGSPILKIPELVTDFFIIMTADPANPVLPLKMNLVNAGEGHLKAGETLWHNMTGHRIAAKLGRAEVIIEPMNKAVSKPPAAASGYYAAALAYQPGGVGDYAPITEQSWWHDANSRHIGFTVNTGGRLPKIFFFRDFRDPGANQVHGGPGNAP